MNRPLVWLSGSFAAGILIQEVFAFSTGILTAVAVLLVLISGYFLFRHASIVPVLLVLAVAAGGLWLAAAETRSPTFLDTLSGKYVMIRGVVFAPPQEQPGKTVCDLKVDSVKFGSREWRSIPEEKVRVYFFKEEGTLQGGEEELHYGDVISVRGKLVLPKGKRNPGDFDYREYLKRRNIHHLLYVYSSSEAVVGTGEGNPVIAAVFSAREFFSKTVCEHMSKRQSALLLGMLFGDQGEIYEEDLEVFRHTGIAHVLSVSGLHVGLVLLLILSLCRVVRLKVRGTLLISITSLCLYCILSAFAVTVVRAAIMGTIGLLAYFLDRQRNIYIALAASALVILVWNPFFLFDPGFQLSFAAVVAIACLEPWLREILPSCLYQHGALLTVPLAAQLGTMPILAYHFNILSPLAVAANILLVPLMSGIVIIGLFAFIISYAVDFFAGALLHSAGYLISLLIYLSEIISSLPGAVHYVAAPSFLSMSLFYLLLITASRFFPAGSRLPANGGSIFPAGWPGTAAKNYVLLAVLTILFLGSFVRPGGHTLQMFFLDVGQGDAIFICSPSGRTVLVDGGGVPGYFGQAFEPGKDIVLPFLRSRGVNKIDLMINTHPDEDHLGGLEDVLAEMEVKQIVTPPVGPWEEKYSDFLETARKKNLTPVEVTRGGCIKFDDEVTARVLWPDKNRVFESSNDSSLVMEVTHGKNKFLLMGDIENQGIRALLKSAYDLDCTLLKIPHHGSAGSFDRTLYERADPEIAVVSVGENNPFGHPSKQVVEYWQKEEVLLFRTDVNGGIVVESDGNKCRVDTVR